MKGTGLMPFVKYPSKVCVESSAPLQTVITLSHQLIQMSRQLNVLMIISDGFYDQGDKDMPDLSSL